jgi:hypothetical protein
MFTHKCARMRLVAPWAVADARVFVAWVMVMEYSQVKAQ